MDQSIYPPLSPILDFSPQGERPSRPITVKQGPQLPLVPNVDTALDKAPKKKSFRPQAIPEIGQASASDSLIEDSSFPEIPGLKTAIQKTATKSRAVAPEPSKLMLQLKERVARHAPSKVLPKTVKLGKAGTAPVSESAAPAGESSIIYVPSSPSSREGTPPPAKKARKQPDLSNVDKGKQRAKGVVTAAKGKKEKPKPVTPFEYAEQLKTKGLAGKTQRRVSASPFLEGYNVFYTGGDRTYASETTRNRMEILVRLGCNLFSRFDPEAVTHIITEGSGGATLHALGVKRMGDIPEHIPTVKWSWVTLGMGSSHMPKDELDEKLRNHLFNHGAFSDRLTAGMNTVFPSSKKGKGKVKSMNEEDISHISDFTQDKNRKSDPRNLRSRSPKEIPPILPSPSISPPGRPMGEASSSRVTLDQDPLAKFYEQAKVSLAEDKGFLSAPSDTEEVLPVNEDPEPKPKKSRYTCDVKDKEIRICPNQDIIDKVLSELMELHKAKPGQEDFWRAFAYSKAIRALKHHPSRIKTYEEARSIRGVGDKTAKKIGEILETGDLRRIGYEKTEDVQVARIFQGIYGVGRTTAYKWYSAGCRTLEDLSNGVGGVKLSSAQEIGLKFYDDINERMPRNEAEAIFHLIKPIALSIDPSLFIEIMGSFRRGKATCGDIDILVTRPVDDGKTHIGVLPRLLEALHAAGILTEDLATPDDLYDLEATYRGLCRLPDVPNSKRRRIDFLTVPWKARGAALLYYTGDDIFNRAMRYKAGAMGYSLNQRGLHAGIVRDPQDRRVKINEGHVVASETEEEIFRILGVPWQEPYERHQFDGELC
ncbi:hypothetical protein MD484_g855, partial [Candolleomyces efflorescens]